MKRPSRFAALLALFTASVFAGACSLSGGPSDDDDDGGESNAGSGAGAGASNAQGGTSAGSSGANASGQGGSGVSAGGSGGTTATAGVGGSAGSSAGSLGQAGTSVAGSTAGSSGATGVGGGAAGSAGSTSTAGAAGAAGSAGSTGTGSGALGDGLMMGMGRSDMQYETALISRNDVPYVLITNGWGPGFQDHTVAWNGTSFIVESMNGTPGSGGQPASYPSVFCGRYSVREVPACGLPAAMDTITTLKTGWRWAANGNTTDYNAAYDIWLGDGTAFTMYLMVWLRDPPRQQPAGSPNAAHQGVTVTNVPGVWNIWTGTVNNRPIINWVRPEGMDSPEIEFDLMDFIRDAQTRGLNVMGTHINAVAVGFEIWQGPITNLASTDFYVDVN